MTERKRSGAPDIIRLTVDGTTNAAVIGRLMNNVRMGYYPTDPDNIAQILRGIRFSEGVTTNLLDPCCGCGKALRHLMDGGLLIYVIPYYRLTPDICRVLCDNFHDLSAWRFTGGEFKKFKQVAVLGTRKRRESESGGTLWLERLAENPAAIPCLTELPEDRYQLPAEPMTVPTFKGEHFNQKELERQLRQSDSFAQMMARSELDSGGKSPLLPLSINQIGLIGGSGMINGLIACDSPHIIKGRIVKVVRTETEEQFSASGEHMGSEITETISNKMIFNVLTPRGFRALT